MADRSDRDVIIRKDLEAHSMAPRLSVATRVIRANRKIIGQATLAVVFAILLSVVTTVTIIFSRPFTISQIEGAAELTSPAGAVVQTGRALTTISLADLPDSADFHEYDRLTSVTIPKEVPFVGEKVFQSVKISSWAWQNTTRMTLTGTDGTIILIDNGSVKIAHAPSGTVGFDAGVKWSVGYNASFIDTSIVESTCASFGCPLDKCGATMTSTFVREISCNSVPLWAWPQGVHLAPPPTGRRHLGDCAEITKLALANCPENAFTGPPCRDDAIARGFACAAAKGGEGFKEK